MPFGVWSLASGCSIDQQRPEERQSEAIIYGRNISCNCLGIYRSTWCNISSLDFLKEEGNFEG